MFALQSCVSQKVAFPLLISRSQGKTHAQSSSKTVSQLFYVPGRGGGEAVGACMKYLNLGRCSSLTFHNFSDVLSKTDVELCSATPSDGWGPCAHWRWPLGILSFDAL